MATRRTSSLVGMTPTQQMAERSGTATYRPDFGSGYTDADYAQALRDRESQTVQPSVDTAHADAVARDARITRQQNDDWLASTGQFPSSTSRAGTIRPSVTSMPSSVAALNPYEEQYKYQQKGINAGVERGRAAIAEAGSAPTAVNYDAVSGEQEQVAREAAFARAKESAGLNARASLKSLQDVVDDRGLTGSSIEAGQAGRVIGGAQSEVGDFIREDYLQDLGRAEKIADMKFQGGIQQRGQDLSRQQAMIALLSGRLY